VARLYNITLNQGESKNIIINLLGDNSTQLNLSGYDVRGQAKTSYGASGILVNLNPYIEENNIRINISSNLSKNFPIGEHVYDIERYPNNLPNENSTRIIYGKLIVLPEVTR